MFDIQREELNWCGRDLVLETGRIARQVRLCITGSQQKLHLKVQPRLELKLM